MCLRLTLTSSQGWVGGSSGLCRGCSFVSQRASLADSEFPVSQPWSIFLSIWSHLPHTIQHFLKVSGLLMAFSAISRDYLFLFLFMIFGYLSGVGEEGDVNSNWRLILKRGFQKRQPHYNMCTLITWRVKHSSGCTKSATICLLRNQAHSFEHAKHAAPGPLHDPSHCRAGSSPRYSHSSSPRFTQVSAHMSPPERDHSRVSSSHHYPRLLSLLYFIFFFLALVTRWHCITYLYIFFLSFPSMSINSKRAGRGFVW